MKKKNSRKKHSVIKKELNTLCYIRIMDYYPQIKTNETLIEAIMWMLQYKQCHDFAKWKKSDKNNAYYLISFVEYFRKCKLTYDDRKQMSSWLRKETKDRRKRLQRSQETLRGDVLISLVVAMVSWVYIYVKIYHIEHYRCIHCIACQLVINTIIHRKWGEQNFL